MRFFNFIALLLFAVQLQAQDVEGYYVTESGKKVDGFFKFADFFETASLKFKQSRGGQFNSLPANVIEYGMTENKLKFEKHTVDIDISGNNSYSRNPEWLKQTVFLCVIVKGNATLYSYTKDYKTFFFFNNIANPAVVSQLIYRKYKKEDESIVESNAFRQQLYNAIPCPGQKASDFADILYDKKQLSEVFEKYNKCTGSKSEVYAVLKRSKFKYSAFAGVHNLNLEIVEASPAVEAESSVTYSFGGEVAYTFRSEDWGLFARVEFESLNSKNEDIYDRGFNSEQSIYKIEGSALNVVFGPRYNLMLSDRSTIIFDAGFCFSKPFATLKRSTLITTETGTSYPGANQEYDLEPGFAVSFGVGFNFDKYGLALRYMTDRDFLDDVYSTYKTKIDRIGLVFSYRLN